MFRTNPSRFALLSVLVWAVLCFLSVAIVLRCWAKSVPSMEYLGPAQLALTAGLGALLWMNLPRALRWRVRRSVRPSAELQADVMYQIGALQGLATAAGTRVRYVKPHGALYNTIAHDERQAKAVIAAVRAVDPTLVLVALAGAPLVQWARDAGLTVVGEAFADRAYTPEGTLVSRREKGAVLHDATLVAQRMLRLVREGVVEAIDGSLARVDAQSICVHGDSASAVEMAQAVRAALEQDGVVLRSFVDPA